MLTKGLTSDNAYENAHAESFNKTIKRQGINISDYDNKDESAISIFRYKEVYNNYKPHSSIENMTPVEYRMSHENKKIRKLLYSFMGSVQMIYNVD